MIIVIGSTKGGSGKTTLATNLSAIDVCRGNDVLLIDCDRQGSASDWGAVRDELEVPRVPVLQKLGGISLTQELKALDKKYERVYCDSGGYDSTELRSSIITADLLLIPVRPSQPDIWSLPRIIEIVAQSKVYNPKLKILFLINGAHTSPNVRSVEDVMAIVDEVEDMQFAKTVLHNRLAYSKAFGQGLSVVEMQGRDKDVKAVDEMLSLYGEILND